MKNKSWKEFCDKCKKNHIVTPKLCPSCNTHTTIQPVSEKVLELHSLTIYYCEGCRAYFEHLSHI